MTNFLPSALKAIQERSILPIPDSLNGDHFRWEPKSLCRKRPVEQFCITFV